MAIELDDGTVVRSLPEQVDYLTTHNEENEIAIDNLAARLEAAISGVLHYKGSVASYADLPADAEVGDVYNCLDTGSNYAWTGSDWDELGTTVDISNCLDKTSGTWSFPQEVTGIIDFKSGLALNSGYVELVGNTSEVFEIQLHGGDYDWTFDSSKLVFNVSNSVDLGSSTYTFKDLYLGGVIDFGNNAKIQKDGSNRVNILYNNAVKVKVGGSDTYFANNVAPDSNNTYDLGRKTLRWRKVYADKIDDGTNEATLTDIIALIAYAKAQGWIS